MATGRAVERTSDELRTLLAVAEEAARAAGAVALRGFRGELDIRSKGGVDIVTQYDTEAEDAALGVIRARYPEHVILAEESGETGGNTAEDNLFWAVDPIDGTHNYALQLPFWCTSVAVGDAATREVLAGAVFDPLHDELFSAMRGGGAHLNGVAISVNEADDLGYAALAYDIGYDPTIAKGVLTLALRIQPHVQRLRLMGSAVLALTYVAAGRFDGYFHLRLMPWDIAAASLLVREAGGMVTDWDGQRTGAVASGIVAASPSMQPRLRVLLNSLGAT
jgi:myo-inositol-1(or 4)-monophosphatase